MSIEERCANAKKCIDPVEHQQKVKQKKDQRRNYIIGELVSRYFPSVQEYDPGTDDENRTRFAPLEAFLYMLSIDTDLVDDLRDRATQLMSENPDGEWRVLT